LITELEAVSKLAPRDLNTKLDLAAAYVSAGRRSDAVKTYRAIVDVDARNVQALKFLGDLYKKDGKVQRAIKYYAQAMKAGPRDPRPYFLLGAAYVEIGDDQAAKRIYLKAQTFARFRPEAYSNLGAIAYRQGKLKESLWYLERAVKQQPKKISYRYNLALSQSASNDTEGAMQNISGALDIHPEHVELNYLKGVVLLRQGRAEEARKAFKHTLTLNKKHQAARHNLAMLDEMKRRATQGEVVIEGK
jgi:Flp pilus assembly protein TadD